MAKSPHLSRNEFVKIITIFLGSIMGVVVGLPAIGYLLSPALKKERSDAWISAGPIESYPVGTPTLFTFTRTTINGWEKTVNSYGAYIYRKTEQELTAFNNVCTHLSCRVTWQEGEQIYLCPCHNGIFDIEGAVLEGPPPRPLYRYETKVEDDTLFIRLEVK
jgi:menaquinol-cytochrome c reductase iron-sulfur subunit